MKKILFGFYYGIGDFISAVPILRHLSKKGCYKIIAAVGHQNRHLTDLLDIQGIEFFFFSLFSAKSPGGSLSFLKELGRIRPDLIIVSPHPQNNLTSWKVPFALKTIKLLNPKILVIGALGDRNSFLYDKRVDMQKTDPLMRREIDFARHAQLIGVHEQVSLENIFKVKPTPGKVISIHAGASRAAKTWKAENHASLVRMLLFSYPEYKIKLFGLAHELNGIRQLLEPSENLEFHICSLREAVQGVLDSKFMITMDSGFSHIASALGIRHLVLFGSGDPSLNMPVFPNSEFVFNKVLPCQPCNLRNCKFEENRCMDLICPEEVFERVSKILNEKK